MIGAKPMNELKYAYITKRSLAFGEVCVEGRAADGRLLFGFRALDSVFWQDRARRYVPSAYIPVFQANRPAALRA